MQLQPFLVNNSKDFILYYNFFIPSIQQFEEVNVFNNCVCFRQPNTSHTINNTKWILFFLFLISTYFHVGPMDRKCPIEIIP